MQLSYQDPDPVPHYPKNSSIWIRIKRAQIRNTADKYIIDMYDLKMSGSEYRYYIRIKGFVSYSQLQNVLILLCGIQRAVRWEELLFTEGGGRFCSQNYRLRLEYCINFPAFIGSAVVFSTPYRISKPTGSRHSCSYSDLIL